MKTLAAVAAAALIALPLAATAQSGGNTSGGKAPAKPAAKTASSTQAKKPQPTRRVAKAAAGATAAAAVAAAAADPNVVLTDTDLAVARLVHTGRIPCELGADVTVTADQAKPGFFTVSTKGARYHMHPVESRTGAIRLEDGKAGAMWLQLSNKSMLMN